MYKKQKEKCPKCGEETLERLWMGFDPQRCNKCGHQEEKPRYEC